MHKCDFSPLNKEKEMLTLLSLFEADVHVINPSVDEYNELIDRIWWCMIIFNMANIFFN